MTAPYQCILWKCPERVLAPLSATFEACGTFVEESHLIRRLLRCRECGLTYFYEFYEQVDWINGDDAQFSTFIPVASEMQIEAMRRSSTLELLRFAPRLQRDFPSDADAPKARWVARNGWTSSDFVRLCNELARRGIAPIEVGQRVFTSNENVRGFPVLAAPGDGRIEVLLRSGERIRWNGERWELFS